MNEGIKYFDFAQIEDFLKIRNHVLYSIKIKTTAFSFLFFLLISLQYLHTLFFPLSTLNIY